MYNVYLENYLLGMFVLNAIIQSNLFFLSKYLMHVLIIAIMFIEPRLLNADYKKLVVFHSYMIYIFFRI